MLEVRLAEVLRAFAVLQSVNWRFSQPDGESVRRSIGERSGFWLPVTLGLQMTVLTGIVALLDKDRKDCATFNYVINQLSSTQSFLLPQDLLKTLDAIRDNHRRYRHKLFAHNDLRRLDVVEEFDKAGFTWASIGGDLTTLDFAAKALRHILAGTKPPTEEVAKNTLYSFNLAEVQSFEKDGWRQVRQQGSHRQFRHDQKAGTVTVAGKDSVEVPPGTLSSILKQAGLKK